MSTTNLEGASITVGNVTLVDPNLVNVNTNMINSIPQYQDMYIFAELTAKSKGRTVIISSNGTNNLDKNSSSNSTVVNFMGNNQDSNSPNYLKFTTNWYDGSSPNGKQYEGFGINNIKVTINSSFVPQINIQFVDVRGVAFFNQNNSPYRILFDFPPPIFKLTLKGYFGKALTYKLHLVKYTSEFRAENGNFVIDAEFIAITFAPLSDILFRYAANVPLIDENVSISPNPQQKPNSIYELILKLKSLYSQSSNKKNTTTDNQTYDNIIKQINNNTDIMSLLNNYNNDETLKKDAIPILLIRNNLYVNENSDELTIIQNTANYDNIIINLSKDGIPNDIDKRLLIAYLINNNTTIINGITGSTSPDIFRTNMLTDILNTYRKNTLITKTNSILNITINENDIPFAGNFNSNIKNNTINPNISNRYVYLDITNYYLKLYKQRINLLKSKSDITKIINTNINNMVINTLGMNPTIYNIFSIILNDVDIFFKKLRSVSKDADNHHNNDENKNKIINDVNRYKDVNNHVYAFPLIIKQEIVSNQTKEIKVAPIELSNNLSQPFPEIIFINDFINTFYSQQKITGLLNMKAEQNVDGTNKWIPISPVDSQIASSNLNSPYFGIDTNSSGIGIEPINLSSDNRLSQIFKIFLKRFYILTQNSFANSFYNKKLGSDNFVEMFSASEAINLVASITNSTYSNFLYTAANQFRTDNGISGFYGYIHKIH